MTEGRYIYIPLWAWFRIVLSVAFTLCHEKKNLDVWIWLYPQREDSNEQLACESIEGCIIVAVVVGTVIVVVGTVTVVVVVLREVVVLLGAAFTSCAVSMQ